MLDPKIVESILNKCRGAPCIESLGLSLLEFDAGFCKLSAKQDARFNGLPPGFHGGMLAAVADCAAWFAIVTRTGPDAQLVTTDLDMRYLAPCNGDATVHARLIKLGKTLCPVHIDIHGPDGKHCVVGQVTYMRVDQLGQR